MKLRRIWGLIATSLATVLLTSGCIKLEMDMTVATDDTVSGNMVFAISKSLAEMAAEESETESATTPETNNLFADAENVTIEPFDDGEFVGSSYSFESLPLAQFAPQVGENSAFAIERQGDNLVISGVLDTSTEGEELEANPFADSITAGFAASTSIRVSVTLPGEIIETNGQVEGQTITWIGTFGERVDLQAVAVSPVSTPINWLLVGGITGIALGISGVLLTVFVGRKKRVALMTESDKKESKDAKPKKKTKAEILAAEALAARPWYQMKRFAFPAMGFFVLSLFAIAISLMQPQGSLVTVEATNPPSTSRESSEVGEGGGEDMGNSSSSSVTEIPTAPAQAPPPAAAPVAEPPKEEVAAPAARPAPAMNIAPSETEGQFLARQDALFYWSDDWYSRTGLINWLMAIGYSYEDSVYGTDSLGVDWNNEAFGMANSILSEYYFSRIGLIFELEAEGFTIAEATSGVDALAHDWYWEAYGNALVYISEQGYSEQEAYDQLIRDYFTEDEALYGSYWAAQG